MTTKIVITNGSGGAGKDEVYGRTKGMLKDYKVKKFSSIDQFRKVARSLGAGKTKTKKYRKYLSDLKRISIEYNDYPLKNMLEKISKNLNGDVFIFIDIREIDEIEKLRRVLENCNIVLDMQIETLLVVRYSDYEWGNDSDDNVENYDYDHILVNNGNMEDLERNIKLWLFERFGFNENNYS